jgi:hypothetical protein
MRIVLACSEAMEPHAVLRWGVRCDEFLAESTGSAGGAEAAGLEDEAVVVEQDIWERGCNHLSANAAKATQQTACVSEYAGKRKTLRKDRIKKGRDEEALLAKSEGWPIRTGSNLLVPHARQPRALRSRRVALRPRSSRLPSSRGLIPGNIPLSE